MKVEYPSTFRGVAKLNGTPAYYFHDDRIIFFNQEDFNDHRIKARLKLKSWKH